MRSTMQEFPLTLTALMRRGRDVFGSSKVVTATESGFRTSSFGEVATRMAQLAGGLASIGVSPSTRVGTLCWNNQEHLEAYFAVPCMGAVLHTLNLRLPSSQLAFSINHAEDEVIICDSSLIPMLEAVLPQLNSLRHIVVIGDAPCTTSLPVHRYAELMDTSAKTYAWPDLEETSAAAMCYTTGTTGDPKGVVYSHRSMYLHCFGVWGGLGLTDSDSMFPVVPMFHVNAWGLPYVGWMLGCDIILSDRFMQPAHLARIIEAQRPNFIAGVPTIYGGLLLLAETSPVDFSSVRLAISGGSAIPESMIAAAQERHGLRIVSAWGMTETSPLGSAAFPPPGCTPEEDVAWRARTGRIAAGIELRITGEDGGELPWDGKSVGEIEARGPWVTGAYYRAEAPDRFHDGWLRTGDVGTIDPSGVVQITDRVKDVIKSGGEWISSVELENQIAGHPDVLEAAVIAVPDERWQERPLACVVPRPGAAVEPEGLRQFLSSRVARWWLPERWALVAEIPKTSVGKFDKKLLRAQYAKGELDVVLLPPLPRDDG